MSNEISRRDAIRGGLGLGAGLILGSSLPTAEAIDWRNASSATKPVRSGGLRFAHMTDMHVQPERRGGEGWTAALQSLKQIDPPPAFLITGGDHVMDSFGQTPARCAVQWDLYQKPLREHVTIPIYSAMGNHDVAGWGNNDRFPADASGYGKAMAIERLGLKSPHYAFDAGDWRFIVLDSLEQRGKNYLGHLGDAQTQWLVDELARVGKARPICIVSHIPILAVCCFFHGERLKETYWHVPDQWMHRDASEIVNLIETYNVRLLISGHMHLIDRCEYRGKTYVCDGAVSGAWWGGPFHEFPEGYGVFDIYPDGSFEHQYVTYGWKADPPPPPPSTKARKK